ncbi:MAG: MBL fold metallo-hydrolase [Rhodocyclaceae bacterium]|nr:MBL fold metallo-hydrolase [Rhodocyclaceae bacterium]
MHIRQFLDRPSGSLSYLLACPESKRAVMIDPVADDLALYLGVLDEMQWQLDYVLETHLHADHLTAAASLRQATGAKIASGDAQMQNADCQLQEGDRLNIGKLQISVIATPGHTPCCLTYHCADRLFTGDCLLIGDCGNLCDNGADAGRLYDSITRKLLRFADETLLYPGHFQQGRQVSCIGDERRNNPLFCGVSRDEFIARMANRPCQMAARCNEIAAANRQCGIPLSKTN